MYIFVLDPASLGYVVLMEPTKTLLHHIRAVEEIHTLTKWRRMVLQMHFNGVNLRNLPPEFADLRLNNKFPCHTTCRDWICIFHKAGDGARFDTSRDTLHAIPSRHHATTTTTTTTTGEELLALAEETLPLSFFFLLRCMRVSIRANIAWGPGGMPPSCPIPHPESYLAGIVSQRARKVCR
jgi:hypothetical protein